MTCKSLYGMHTNPNYLLTHVAEGSPKVTLHARLTSIVFFLRNQLQECRLTSTKPY
jgi:hypothetical protein